MKLSEAIRLGAMLLPQGFGFTSMAVDASCGLIAACDALGLQHSNAGVTELNEMFPWMGRTQPGCPLCRNFDGFSIGGLVAHLNDSHGWTRERIADWVETIEARQDKLVETPVLVASFREDVG